MSLLPQNFDDKIASTLKNYRYRRSIDIDEVESNTQQGKDANTDVEETESDKETKIF